MKDITLKPSTLREARAEALVKIPSDTLQLVRDGGVDKGDPLEAARIAGMMGIKRCWELLPHCHPLPLQSSEVSFELNDDGLRIETMVATIGPTGVEMEALTGASIAALTVYDMLKPHAGMNLEITGTRLLSKTGGKSDHRRALRNPLAATILTVSTAIADGHKRDAAGQWLADELTDANFAPVARRQTQASPESIREALQSAVNEQPALLLTLGGTGLTADDYCVQVVEDLLEQNIPGIMEAARGFGQSRSPKALISRGVAGRIGNTLVITLPGSQRGAMESWSAVQAGVVHAIEVLQRG